MINVLLSTYDFNNEHCFKKLKDILSPNMTVCIIPFSHSDNYYENEEEFDDLYHFDYGYELKFIAKSYHDYGISKEQIRVINPFRDNKKLIEYKILNSDVLFFTGGDPVKAMKRMEDIIDIIKRFNGIVMGASAGAMVQVDEFVISSEGYPYSYHKGLGLIKKDVEPIVHFKFCSEYLRVMLRSMVERPQHHLIPLKDGKYKIYRNQ
jgi:peptidase E